MLEFDDFVRRVIQLLNLDHVDPVDPQDGLYDQLALDSFQALQLVVAIESMADVLVPPVEIPELYTVQDAFDYYRSLRELAAS